MNLFDKSSLIPYLAIDCVIFGYKEKKLHVLVSKLRFKGEFHSLPSGFIDKKEGVNDAAIKILRERTSLSDIYLEHFKIFGEADRCNKQLFEKIVLSNKEELEKVGILENFDWLTSRFISLGFYALVDINKVEPIKTEIDESLSWYEIDKIPEMILDQNQMINDALDSLRLNLNKNIIILNLLPDTFVMKEIQDLYETIFNETYARNNFQKKVLDLGVLERLEKKFTGANNKAPYLYRFRR